MEISVCVVALFPRGSVWVDVVDVTFIFGSVFSLEFSVGSEKMIFGKTDVFRFILSLASLTVVGFCFVYTVFLFGGLLCQLGSDRLSSRSDSPCHFSAFVDSPVCSFGMKLLLKSIMLCLQISLCTGFLELCVYRDEFELFVFILN